MITLLLNRKKLRADAKLLGQWGERRCQKYLQKKGMRFLAGNYSCKAGEIDLVMVDNSGAIVFTEVKTRANESFAAAEDAITEKKKNKMIRAARYFMANYNLLARPYRFDVVTIALGEKGPPKTTHYQNAFIA